jgi:ribosomal protein S18 acetylase RimI-like enzyme
MTPDVVIRPARPDDLERVARLAGKLVRMHHDFDRLRFFLPERVEEGYRWWFEQEIDRDEVVLLVAERGPVPDGGSAGSADSAGSAPKPPALVGYAYGRLEDRDWNQLLDACGALHDLWVEEGDRRGGIASRLVEAAVAALREKGAPRVILHTAAGNTAAQALFARLGFRATMVEMTREAKG